MLTLQTPVLYLQSQLNYMYSQTVDQQDKSIETIFTDEKRESLNRIYEKASQALSQCTDQNEEMRTTLEGLKNKILHFKENILKKLKDREATIHDIFITIVELKESINQIHQEVFKPPNELPSSSSLDLFNLDNSIDEANDSRIFQRALICQKNFPKTTALLLKLIVEMKMNQYGSELKEELKSFSGAVWEQSQLLTLGLIHLYRKDLLIFELDGFLLNSLKRKPQELWEDLKKKKPNFNNDFVTKLILHHEKLNSQENEILIHLHQLAGLIKISREEFLGLISLLRTKLNPVQSIDQLPLLLFENKVEKTNKLVAGIKNVFARDKGYILIAEFFIENRFEEAMEALTLITSSFERDKCCKRCVQKLLATNISQAFQVAKCIDNQIKYEKRLYELAKAVLTTNFEKSVFFLNQIQLDTKKAEIFEHLARSYVTTHLDLSIKLLHSLPKQSNRKNAIYSLALSVASSRPGDAATIIQSQQCVLQQTAHFVRLGLFLANKEVEKALTLIKDIPDLAFQRKILGALEAVWLEGKNGLKCIAYLLQLENEKRRELTLQMAKALVSSHPQESISFIKNCIEQELQDDFLSELMPEIVRETSEIKALTNLFEIKLSKKRQLETNIDFEQTIVKKNKADAELYKI